MTSVPNFCQGPSALKLRPMMFLKLCPTSPCRSCTCGRPSCRVCRSAAPSRASSSRPSCRRCALLPQRAGTWLPVCDRTRWGFVKRSVRPWDVAALWLAAGGEPARSSSSTWQGLPPRGDHPPRVHTLKAQRPLGLCPGLGAPLRLQGNRFFRYATCASSLRTRSASSSSRVGGTARPSRSRGTSSATLSQSRQTHQASWRSNYSHIPSQPSPPPASEANDHASASDA